MEFDRASGSVNCYFCSFLRSLELCSLPIYKDCILTAKVAMNSHSSPNYKCYTKKRCRVSVSFISALLAAEITQVGWNYCFMLPFSSLLTSYHTSLKTGQGTLWRWFNSSYYTLFSYHNAKSKMVHIICKTSKKCL